MHHVMFFSCPWPSSTPCRMLLQRVGRESVFEPFARLTFCGERIDQSNAVTFSSVLDACSGLWLRLRALDCIDCAARQWLGNRGGGHRKCGRPGAPWHPGDACTPWEAAGEWLASVAALVHLVSADGCDAKAGSRTRVFRTGELYFFRNLRQ